MIAYAIVSAEDKEVQELINKLDNHMRELYAEYVHEDKEVDDWFDHWTELAKPHVSIIGAEHEGKLVDIGAIKDMGEYSELKRVYVEPEYRGRGVADQIIAILEMKSFNDLIKLETGTEQPDAIKFFERAGYTECEAFGDYADELYHEASVYMEKRL